MGKKLSDIFAQEYIVPFILYILTPIIVKYFFLLFGINDDPSVIKDTSIIIKFIAVTIAIYIYRSSYQIRLRFGGTSFFWGLLIFVLWVAFSEFHAPQDSDWSPGGGFIVFIKLLTGVVLAPLIEEFFTRFYLLRVLIKENWRSVPLGKFTWTSFIITVLFFGFSHTFWVAGLVTGIILNIIYYIYRRVDECVMAHAWANLLLGLFVIINQEWIFW